MGLIQSLKEQLVQNENDVYLFTLMPFQTQVLLYFFIFISVEHKMIF